MCTKQTFPGYPGGHITKEVIFHELHRQRHEKHHRGDPGEKKGRRRDQESLFCGLRRQPGGPLSRQELYGAGERRYQMCPDQQQRVCPQHPQGLWEELCHLLGLPQGQHPGDHRRRPPGQGEGGLTWLEQSEIVAYGDYVVCYAFDASPDHLAGDIDYGQEKTVCALLVAVELLEQTSGYENYDKFMAGREMLTSVIRNARAHVAKRALAFAEEYKDDSIIYTMGSGAGYGAAYMESICIFMEMQWLDSSSIHTGEYFHGPFEITDENRPFMIQVSEGSTRPLDERCLNFLRNYAKRIEVLDAKELGLSVIDPAVVDYFNHSLFNNVYPIYNHALAEARKHPLPTRRYMWKVEY